MKTLDFLIIGAQKCATTTLFELLSRHPSISMPLEKEAPFFTDPDCSTDTWQAFAEQHLPEHKTGLWGKATPQYMCDPGTAARIQRLMPDIKLIAILRDPAARTRSHFMMNKRRDLETRSIDDALAPLISASASLAARQKPVPLHENGFESEADFYIAWSEYGAALEPFATAFSRTQLLVLYTEELNADPAGTLDRVMAFLGLPVGYRPRQLGQRLHTGGGGVLVPQSVRLAFRRTWLYRLWKLIPPNQQGRLRFLYDRWNSRRTDPAEDIPNGLTLKAMRQHFRRDLDKLVSLGIEPPPWISHYSTE